MRYQYFKLCILLAILTCSCNKTNVEPSATSTQSPTNNQLTAYDTLSPFNQQNAVWNFMRIDSLIIDMSLLVFNPPSAFSWTAKQIPDTLFHYDSLGNRVIGPYTLVYKDTSYETFTISGSSNFGQLKKYYENGNNGSPINPTTVYTNPSITFMQYTLNVNDTALCNMLFIKNITRNTVDTEYIYLSNRLFSTMPERYTSAQNQYGLLDFGFQLPLQLNTTNPIYAFAFREKTDTSFRFSNTAYPTDICFINTNSYRSGNGLLFGNASKLLFVSKQKGLLSSTFYKSDYMNMYGTETIIINRFRLN